MDRDIDVVDALVYLKIICLLVSYCITQFGPLGGFSPLFLYQISRQNCYPQMLFSFWKLWQLVMLVCGIFDRSTCSHLLLQLSHHHHRITHTQQEYTASSSHLKNLQASCVGYLLHPTYHLPSFSGVLGCWVCWNLSLFLLRFTHRHEVMWFCAISFFEDAPHYYGLCLNKFSQPNFESR